MRSMDNQTANTNGMNTLIEYFKAKLMMTHIYYSDNFNWINLKQEDGCYIKLESSNSMQVGVERIQEGEVVKVRL